MRSFVLGDIHGAFRALKQCFARAGFDYEHDRLICLGDVYDGWSEARQCIDELQKIKNLIYVLGNHDYWTMEWALTGNKNPDWLEQGGDKTITGYNDENATKR